MPALGTPFKPHNNSGRLVFMTFILQVRKLSLPQVTQPMCGRAGICSWPIAAPDQQALFSNFVAHIWIISLTQNHREWHCFDVTLNYLYFAFLFLFLAPYPYGKRVWVLVHCLLAMCLWANVLTLLSLNFFYCKIGDKIKIWRLKTVHTCYKRDVYCVFDLI
jgi:hypothetical protein